MSKSSPIKSAVRSGFKRLGPVLKRCKTKQKQGLIRKGLRCSDQVQVLP